MIKCIGCDESIKFHPAARCLDATIASRIYEYPIDMRLESSFGYVFVAPKIPAINGNFNVPRFSSSIRDAYRLAAFLSSDYQFTLKVSNKRPLLTVYGAIFVNKSTRHQLEIIDRDPSLAIARSALLAMG